MEEKKSGLDLLAEILDSIKLLDKRMEVIEQKMNIILSKNNESKTFSIKAAQEVKMEVPELKNTPKVRVEGFIENGEKVRQTGIVVSIYDNANNLVKETRTNRSGTWQAFLPEGQKYIIKTLINNQDKILEINVDKGSKLFKAPKIVV